MKDWTIADRYFYQAGPLPDDSPEPRKCATCGNPESNHTYRHIFKPAPLVDGVDPKLGLAEVVKSPCKVHRSYLAKRKPQTPCEACWRFYVGRNP